MRLVENELTNKNIERAKATPEFEKRNETEHKLVPQYPELIELLYKDAAYPIEQIYLSNPNDESSLRVRCDYRPGPEGNRYTATLKSRGDVVDGALQRIEVETPISEEAFTRYQAMGLPTIYKLRTKLEGGVTIDFYDNPALPVLIEVEGNDRSQREQSIKALEEATGQILIDRSDDPSLTNEAIAYSLSGETYTTPESLEAFTDRVVKEMIGNYVIGKSQVVAGLTGMSGSGKTTVTNAIQERIVELLGEAYKPIIVSTDDYHFGKTALEATYGTPYSDWDHPRTYNTAKLASDLELLANGIPVLGNHFNFTTEEPEVDRMIEPSPFVIVEGLYAGSKDLASVRDVHFELPTTIATSVSRDIRRLIIENRVNRAFANPESRLKYQLETAVPLYMSQEKPNRPSFSASARPMAERAFMLGTV